MIVIKIMVIIMMMIVMMITVIKIMDRLIVVFIENE